MNAFLQDNAQDIAQAAQLLESGEVVAVPAETVYGLAGHALNEEAVRAIFEIKGRPLIDPLIVHVHSLQQIEELAIIDTPYFASLAQAFWPGPLTLILPKKAVVPDLVTAGKETVALRMPAHPLFQKILQTSALPLAAPSANPFGYISPTQAQHVADSLGDKLKYIIDGGASQEGLESTIVDLSKPNEINILRPGPITQEQLEKCLKTKVNHLKVFNKEQNSSGESAPGTLIKHYSPRTPLTLLSKDSSERSRISLFEKNTAYIQLFRHGEVPQQFATCDKYWLSESNDLREAAQNVFALLRKLDKQDYSNIYCEQPKAEGIGIALLDRLTRAAAQ